MLGGPKINPPLTHVLPAGHRRLEGLRPLPVRPDKAKQLLAEAGYPNGLTLKFLYRNASEGSSKTFQTVQQDLRRSASRSWACRRPDADFYTKYLQVPTAAKRGVWDLSLAGWGADWYGNAALSFFAPLFSGKPSFPPIGSNFGFYDNPATNDADRPGRRRPRRARRPPPLWAKADQQVMKDARVLPDHQPEAGQLPRHAGAQRGLHARHAELRPGQRLARRKDKQGG